MKTSKTVKSRSELKRLICQHVYSNNDLKDSFVVVFNECLSRNTYRITIEQVNLDCFIDEKGQKWIKSK